MSTFHGKTDSVLPPDFDGVFRFTNFTDEEFKAKWGKVEYTFPAQKTIPLIVPGHSPEQVQHIRKKFARELAVQEFYKTKKFKKMDDTKPGEVPALYTDSDLEPFIQRCLEPLPIAQATLKILPSDDQKKFRVDRKTGKPVTQVLEEGQSLMGDSGGTIA